LIDHDETGDKLYFWEVKWYEEKKPVPKSNCKIVERGKFNTTSSRPLKSVTI
jgi:hypothetical protein